MGYTKHTIGVTGRVINGCYCICGQLSAAASPLDATTYYAGGAVNVLATNQDLCRTYVPRPGTVRSASIAIDAYLGTGTNEAWTVKISNGTDDETVATVAAATTIRNFYNNNMSLAIAEGGYVQLKTTTPTWATNPTGVLAWYAYIIEFD